MRAVVTGMIATYAVGGVVWDYGQYLLGLQQLGFEVYYLEDTGWEAYNPRVGGYGSDYAFGAAYLEDALRCLSPELAGRWHLRGMQGETYGLDADAMEDVVADADLLLNVSGAALLRPSTLRSRRKVLIDTDPGWNHFRNYPRWDAQGANWQGSAGWRAHDSFFTYAEAIGSAGCTLPSLGVDWLPTRPVVVPDRWSGRPDEATAWTTVMTWDNFREPIVHSGTTYGSKEMEFPKVEDLPQRVSVPLEVAVGGASPPTERWRSRGWRVVRSQDVSRTAADYRDYVETSRGELSVAKNVYVATGSGWFSCRSTCYLAAGVPVVVQDTGFSASIPCGEGLLAFSTGAQAASAVAAVEADRQGHAEAARTLAEREFGPERVLGDLLARIGLD